MPRLEHRVDLEKFPYEVQMVFHVLLDEINVLRQQVDLPPRTPQQRRETIRHYVRDHPRPTRQGG